jgi:hypothetical protein
VRPLITAVEPAAPTVRFHGVARASRLGILLSASVSSLCAGVSCEEASPESKHWKRAVSGTDLQWWEERPSADVTVSDQTPDVLVDLFGTERVSTRRQRIWRVVDAVGEAILNPFCLLETSCRRPFVTSMFLIERRWGCRNWTIIAEAHISNRQEYRALLNRVAHVVVHLIGSALRDLKHRSAPLTSLVPTSRKRSWIEIAVARFLADTRRVASVLRETMFKENWAIGVLTARADDLLQSQDLRPDSWFQASTPHTYLADPFPLPGRPDILLCESYDYRVGRGSLRALTLMGRVARELPVDLHVDKKHLSYPCTFGEAGRVFLLPEMAAFDELILFEMLSESDAKAVCLVDRGTRIADPTLFYHNEFYWIAYCDQDFGTHDNLCLLYARRLEGPWRHHRKNPVKVDVRSSRPGGTLFSVNGKLYRPAQDCSASYGQALVVNEVRVCTPDDYEEEPVARLAPSRSGPFPHGLHTLSIDGNRILLDGNRLIFDPTRLWNRLHAHFRRSRQAAR